MEHTMIPHERDRLNDAIEQAYDETLIREMNIKLYKQMERGYSVDDLYSEFFWWFGKLVGETKHITKVSDIGQPQLKASKDWLEVKAVPKNETDLLRRCDEGIVLFEDYSSMLWNNGILALPSG